MPLRGDFRTGGLGADPAGLTSLGCWGSTAAGGAGGLAAAAAAAGGGGPDAEPRRDRRAGRSAREASILRVMAPLDDRAGRGRRCATLCPAFGGRRPCAGPPHGPVAPAALCSISAEWSLHAQVQDPAGPRMCDRLVSSRAFDRSMGRWGVCGCMPLLSAGEVRDGVKK